MREIENAVPLPSVDKRRWTKYRFHHLQPGQSYVLDPSFANDSELRTKLKDAARRHGYRHGFKYVFGIDDNGDYRIWREK